MKNELEPGIEFVSCNLCGQRDTIRHLHTSDWTLVRCCHCGLIYTNPRPSTEKLSELYTREYFGRFVSDNPSGFPTDQEEMEACVSTQTLRVMQIGQCVSGPGRLLDVGCGPGFFMARAAREGWSVQGIDVSAEAANYGEEYLGLKIRVGTPENVGDLWCNRFHVITMFHLLEHLPDPVAALCAVGNALRKKGTLVVTVPNIGSSEARYFGADWKGLDLPYHLYHFDPRSLSQILEKAGFEVLSVHRQASQLVADWVKHLLLRRQPSKQAKSPNRGGPASNPRISTASRLYRATVGRIITGRGMTVMARKL